MKLVAMQRVSTCNCGGRLTAAHLSRPARGQRLVVRAASAVEIPHQYKHVNPKGDKVLVQIAGTEDKTTGGVLLPVSAQRKPTSGDVVAVGDGRLGDLDIQMTLQQGDTVLYNKFGIGTVDLEVQGQTHTLIREDDCIGIMPRSGATADDVPELRPVGDRVLLRVHNAATITSGGVVLPDGAVEKPISGTVVRVGPGKKEKGGKRKTPVVKEGDNVLYFKYAGENLETPGGEQYVVVHEEDILCRC